MADARPRHRHPQQERSRLTYDRLLDAAGGLLERVGIERISANLICEAAQLTPPAFYRYFDDKYALLEALAERLMASQNVVLQAWIEAYGGLGLDVMADRIIELLQTMAVTTDAQPGSLWIMRAMHAVPSLAPIRLRSHNFVADLLAETYRPYLPGVDYPSLRRRVRLSVEIAYSVDEMLKEEDIDRDKVFEDAHFVLRSIFQFPEYRPSRNLS